MMKIIFLLIEAFLFPYFLTKVFDLHNNKKFVVVFISQFVILYANQYMFTNHYLCALLIILINIYLIKNNNTHNSKLDSILIPIFYSFVIVLIDICVLFVIQIPDVLVFMNKLGYDSQIILMDSVESLVLILVTYGLINAGVIKKLNLDANKWKQAYIGEIAVLIMGIVLGKFVLINPFLYKFLYLAIFGLSLLNILFISIIYKANKLYEENIKLVIHKQSQEFSDEKLRLIKSVKNEIDAIDHRMFYIIFKIDHLLENNEIDKIKVIIDKYKEVITKHNMIIDTSNAVFDCLLSLKINDLLANDVVVKTCVFISEDEFYDNLSFINFMTRMLDFFGESKEIQLFVNEEPGVTMIKIIYDHCSKPDDLQDYIKQTILNFNGNYKLNENQNEVKIVIRR